MPPKIRIFATHYPKIAIPFVPITSVRSTLKASVPHKIRMAQHKPLRVGMFFYLDSIGNLL